MQFPTHRYTYSGRGLLNACGKLLLLLLSFSLFQLTAVICQQCVIAKLAQILLEENNTSGKKNYKVEHHFEGK